MTAPQRIQRKRTRGSRMPADAVYVGRPSRWGNPFVIGAVLDWSGLISVYGYPEAVKDHAHAVALYRDWLVGRAVPRTGFGPKRASRDHVLNQLDGLRGRDLACWCAPGLPCHADVLIELANA